MLYSFKLIPEESAQISNRSKLHKMLIYFSYFAFYDNISLLITGFCKMMQNIEVHLNDTKSAKSSKLLICTCLIITRAGFLLINQTSSGAGEFFMDKGEKLYQVGAAAMLSLNSGQESKQWKKVLKLLFLCG